jgi:hypothetical protein
MRSCGATVGRVSSAARTVRRPRALLAAAGVLLLTGCGGGTTTDESAGSSAPTPSSAAETSAPDLASGLLPAEAFPDDATVVAVSLEQLRAGAGLSAMGKDFTVTPEECAPAVQGTQPDLDAFEDVTGLSATTPTGATVEILLRGGPTTGAVDLLSAAAERCPQAQISSPEIGTATVTFEEVPVPDLGDGAVALRFTTVVTAPDGTRTTVPALIGVFEDGDRLGLLTSLPVQQSGPAPDPAAFAHLLAQAFEVQADALG